MITYPAFVAALEGKDLHQVAAAAGVPVAEIAIVAAGGWPVPRAYRDRLAAALGVADVAALFRVVSVYDGGTADLEPALPAERFVTDPEALRQIDRRSA